MDTGSLTLHTPITIHTHPNTRALDRVPQGGNPLNETPRHGTSHGDISVHEGDVPEPCQFNTAHNVRGFCEVDTVMNATLRVTNTSVVLEFPEKDTPPTR